MITSITKFVYNCIKIIIALIFAIFVGTCVYFFSNEEHTSISKGQSNLIETNTSDKSAIDNSNARAIIPEKLIHYSVDEITGEGSYYVSTKSVYPIKKLKWPYHDLKSFIGFGCNADSKSGWIYIGFTKNPNLVGWNYINTLKVFESRVRWGDTVGKLTLFENTVNDGFLHIKHNSNFMKNTSNNSSLKIELQFYQEGDIYFEYKNLQLFSKAVNLAQSKCRSL